MKRKKRRNIIIWSVVALIVVIAGYFSFIRPQQQAKRTVTVGIMAGSKQDDEIWNSVSKTAKDKYNVTLKFKRFTDYNQPNKALENGDVDLNAFQHKLFLQTWNKAHKTDLISLGDTFISPIRIYSKKYKSIKEIPNGGTISVPNDASNESRALFALKNAGLINLKKGTKLATVSSISNNPHDLKIKELAADQTARSLDNVDAAVVNTNYAQAAGLNYKSAIFVEPINKDSKQWVNVIAVKGSEKNNKIYKDVVRAYQTEKTIRETKKLYGTSEIPAWDLNFNK
ncbi:MetQ/NlpA family ABC transporter substrate-binding protein [Limosilactobacillus reuteri]|uniref:MetQ/NlpA family ABC transporter substrate-binding protein n=1 Tax=Limosilactobacillus reuteri TaxID=1598 RepID=UPI001C0D3DB4|nr:MetQ/NlpA family ABC transporter substrate-binding protein [Limosilactobacillus reuteri]MCC4466568.1 MetQ/NlpA family ABC transporter substrate-binding protein [Limosilactobacillus reuteri]MCC4466598.1 MetQ/NlpA family ABC transporter substrate-binding protein [Limosilactobacillus reuteri]MCC4466721.1 MetQ/NlpA family ABC transporter substrate-binding protein [Limosilactobacillus reuteri]MCC4467302.1 MetQ/NlpA family ABC transporter substrate-binding protein [Limosilactobacillus reuteri]MCC